LAFSIHTFLDQGTTNYGDDWVYIHYANEILEQGIFAPDTEALDWQLYEGQAPKERNASWVGPLFPLIVAIAFFLFSNTLWPIVLMNALASAFLCVLVYRMSKEIFTQRVAQVAMVWCGVYFLYMANLSRVMKEVWVAMLFLGLVLLVLKWRNSSSPYKTLLLIALVFTCLIHMDERYTIYLLWLIMAIGLLNMEGRMRKVISLVVLVAVMMVPWLVRNYMVYDKLVILTPRTSHLVDKVFAGNTSDYPVLGHTAPDSLRKGYITADQVEEVINGQRITDNKDRLLPKGQIAAMKNSELPKSFSLSQSYWSVFVQLWQRAVVMYRVVPNAVFRVP